jgi:HlyD family secretion protein
MNMATSVSLPLARPRSARRKPLVWALVAVALLAVAGTALYLSSSTANTVTTTNNTYAVTRGSVVASVAGSGSVAANQTLDLSFSTAGTVVETSVALGDEVSAGQVLARLDDAMLQLLVVNAQANLDSAQAQLDALQAGPTAAELTSAQWAVVNAEVQVQQLTEGPTAADVTAARSALLSAQDNLAMLQAGSDPVAIANAQAALEQAKNSLYSQQMSRDATCAKPGVPCDQANVMVGNGEISVRQAQAALDRLLAGPTQTELQVAQYAVQQANARLAALFTAPTAEQTEAAQLQLQNAQARLDELTAGAAAADLAKAQASVAAAQLSLTQAQAALEAATLRAPFDGIVTALNLSNGAAIGSGATALTLLDRSGLHVDLKLSENSAVKVQAGQPVTLTFVSLNGKTVTGTVSYVSPVAETTNGVVTYAVRVNLAGSDAEIRIGMTANLVIVTAQKDNVLLVPNTALLPQGDGQVVVRIGGAGPAGGQVQTPVETGLTDGTYTEIMSGLNEGDVIQSLATATTTTSSGAPGGPGGLGIPFLGGLFGGGR